MKTAGCLAILVCMIVAGCAFGAENGINIGSEPGEYLYKEDFASAKFLDIGFPVKLGVKDWREGSIFNKGPNSGRELVYRFYSDKLFAGFSIKVEQAGNMVNLGSWNELYVSENGLDWVLADSSREQNADPNGWQNLPLKYNSGPGKNQKIENELYIKLLMNNNSGLNTGESNTISDLEVNIHKSARESVKNDPYTKEREAFDTLAKSNRAVFENSKRDKCCLEDVDGRIIRINERPVTFESNSILTAKKYVMGKRLPTAAVLFVRTQKRSEPVYAAISLKCTKDASRKVDISWNGKSAGQLDAGSFLETNRTFYLKLADNTAQKVNTLRIGGEDSGSVRLLRCEFASAGAIELVDKPTPANTKTLKVLDACYIPDPAPPAASQAVEGRVPPGTEPVLITQKMYAEHADFGAIRVILKNDDTDPVYVGNRVKLNGLPIEHHYLHFLKSEWDARGVVWYRMQPSLLAPGECGELYIRFKRRLDGENASIMISPENTPALNIKVPYTKPTLSIDYASTNKDMQTLYLYVRNANGAMDGVEQVRIDDINVDPERIEMTDVYGDIIGLTVRLDSKLTVGRYCTVQVFLSNKNSAAARFRVLPFWFPRSSYYVPPEVCNSVGMNLTMARSVNLETCEKYDIYTYTEDLLQGQKRIRLVLGPDEPDAKDYVDGGEERGLGRIARKLAESGWQELVERYNPQAASWLMMNGTIRPLNWGIYAKLANICAFDPYPVTFYGADHNYVGESLNFARLCGVPNRMYACLEAYGWQSGSGVPRDARGPSVEEYRQNVVQAIGAGAKGITSWVYLASAGGWQNRPEFAAQIQQCNKMIEQIEDLLIVGTPVNGVVSSDAGKVLTGTVDKELWEKDRVKINALLCGLKHVVITAANHIPASKKEPVILPAKNFNITVKLPDNFVDVKVYEVTAQGLAPVKAEMRGKSVVIWISELTTGRVFTIESEKIQ